MFFRLGKFEGVSLKGVLESIMKSRELNKGVLIGIVCEAIVSCWNTILNARYLARGDEDL